MRYMTMLHGGQTVPTFHLCHFVLVFVIFE